MRLHSTEPLGNVYKVLAFALNYIHNAVVADSYLSSIHTCNSALRIHVYLRYTRIIYDTEIQHMH